MLFERDLMALDGFWPHHNLACSKKLQMSRDASGEEPYPLIAIGYGQ